MTSSSRHTLPVLNYLRRQYLGRWPVARCWLSRPSDRLGRMKALSALLLFAIYPIMATPQELSVHDQVADHAQKAEQYLRAKQPDRAIPEFRSILVLDPDNVDALGNLGVLLFFHGEYGGAATQLQAALKLNPGLWKIQALLGMARRRTGDSAGSMANLEQAFPKLEDRGIQIEAGMELVEMYAGREELEEAAHVLQVLRHNSRRTWDSLCVLPHLLRFGGRIDAQFVTRGAAIRSNASIDGPRARTSRANRRGDPKLPRGR